MAWPIKRGPVYYIRYSLAGKKHKFSTGTDRIQIATEKLRQFESAQARGDDSPLPTKTQIADVLTAYVTHIRATKTAKSAQTDIYYLRDAFGPICDAVRVTSRKISAKAKKRPPKPGQDRRRKAAVIEATCFEQISTAQIAAFISGQVASRGLAPKTANRYSRNSHPAFQLGDDAARCESAERQEPSGESGALPRARTRDSIPHASAGKRTTECP